MRYAVLSWIVLGALAVGCSDSATTDPTSSNPATGGKSDEVVSEQDQCIASGGTWTDDAADAYYCLCASDKAFVVGSGCMDRGPIRDLCDATGGTYEEGEDYAYCACPGDRFVDHGSCLAPDPAEEAACLAAGGLWTDDSADSFYCWCGDTATYVPDQGCVANTEIQATCEATGGEFSQVDGWTSCICPPDRFVRDGNCLAPIPGAQEACEGSGGVWTDDASDSYYCICADNTEIYDGGSCP